MVHHYKRYNLKLYNIFQLGIKIYLLDNEYKEIHNKQKSILGPGSYSLISSKAFPYLTKIKLFQFAFDP